ncbi:MAG TPA: hypothetical protein VFV95_16530 [Vicinamibacterales bacterium]|nr:hypothetical protein [Vicinamibacterales bacterium]
MSPIHRRHPSRERRRLGRRLEIALPVVLVALVVVAAAVAVRYFMGIEATIGFDEANRAAGTFPAIVTVDRDRQVQTTAICRARQDGPSDCRVVVKLRRGDYFIQVRLKHPDGRWTPDSAAALIEIR